MFLQSAGEQGQPSYILFEYRPNLMWWGMYKVTVWFTPPRKRKSKIGISRSDVQIHNCLMLRSFRSKIYNGRPHHTSGQVHLGGGTISNNTLLPLIKSGSRNGAVLLHSGDEGPETGKTYTR